MASFCFSQGCHRSRDDMEPASEKCGCSYLRDAGQEKGTGTRQEIGHSFQNL